MPAHQMRLRETATAHLERRVPVNLIIDHAVLLLKTPKLRCMLLMHTFRDMTSEFIPSMLTLRRLSSAPCSKQSTYRQFAVEDKRGLGAFAKLRKATLSFGFLSLTLRLLMSYIYMEHLFLMFLDHTQRRSTVGRTPLDE